jgi:hypothetical protein
MNFRVGPYLYRVRSVEGYIEHEGESCLGLCDNERHELLISDQASETQQVQVLCHEYIEAWLYHFGQKLPRLKEQDKEAYCDLFGLAMTQFVLDLMHTLRVEGKGAREAEDPDEVVARGRAGDLMPASAGGPGQVGPGEREDEQGHRACDDAAGSQVVGEGPVHVRMTEHVQPGEPGSRKAWRLRIFEAME